MLDVEICHAMRMSNTQRDAPFELSQEAFVSSVAASACYDAIIEGRLSKLFPRSNYVL